MKKKNVLKYISSPLCSAAATDSFKLITEFNFYPKLWNTQGEKHCALVLIYFLNMLRSVILFCAFFEILQSILNQFKFTFQGLDVLYINFRIPNP